MSSRESLNFIKERNNNDILYYEPANYEHDDYKFDDIYKLWKNCQFQFIESSDDKKGLRPPQIGGLFSALAHLRSNPLEQATIVMPTGTGKTETMISLAIAGKFKKTLILVPSNSLRDQTRLKFQTLGLLKELKTIDEKVPNPYVLTIKQIAKSKNDTLLIEKANVVISTPSSIGRFDENILESFSDQFTHLIVDEAHHVKARSWDRIKSKFLNKKPIFQFTATPFREDGLRIDGNIIFNYSIEDAQREGYFTNIEFYPVTEFVEEKEDESIAKLSVKLLKNDLKSGHDHILMARTSSIDHANKVFKLYQKHNELNPVIINKETLNQEKVISDILNGNHRIVVCVGMLGEGFDLPKLKIAALHDIHKSVSVTLQFIGRFIRSQKDPAFCIGNAKFVANIANPKVKGMLDELYEQDADWNRIIKEIGRKKYLTKKNFKSSEVISTIRQASYLTKDFVQKSAPLYTKQTIQHYGDQTISEKF